MNDTGAGSDRVTFSISDSTVTIKDTLGGGSLQVDADGLSTVQPALTDRFLFPVDNAISFETEKLTFQSQTTIRLRDEYGDDLGSFSTTQRDLSRGTYCLDITADIKIYIRVCDGAFSAAFAGGYHSDTEFTVTFDTSTNIVLGARSNHTLPEATITVPDSPESLARVLPYLGSSIKEFSPERSWPSLRGHPPQIEHGSEIYIPEHLSKPDTGIRVTVKPSYADLYRVTPLVYYFGADLELGDEPALHLDLGYAEPLETPTHSLTETVNRLLSSCFYLDTITRIGGYYSLPRQEYEYVAEKLPFYPENLSELTLSEQLMEYLEVPFDTLEPYLPKWPLSATLREGPDDMELLPYLCNDLANIRVGQNLDAYTSSKYNKSSIHGTTVSPATGKTLLTTDSYRTGLSYTAVDPSEFSAVFVFTDTHRAETLEQLFSTAPNRFSALLDNRRTIITAPTVAQLQRVFQSDADLIYIDHPISDGLVRCSDGTVDLSSITSELPSVISVVNDTDLQNLRQLNHVGLLCGMSFNRHPDVVDLFSMSVLIAAGISVSQVASSIPVSSQLIGATTQQIVLQPDGRVPAEFDLSPITDDLFELTTTSSFTNHHPIGSVKIFDQFFEEGSFQLMGTIASKTVALSNEEILHILSESPTSTFANIPIYYPYDLSVEFIEHATHFKQNDIPSLDILHE